MYSWRKVWIASILALSHVFGIQSSLQAQELDGEQLYNSVVRSCVFIQNKEGMGSGSLIDTDKKIILTNYHVVGDLDTCWVQFPIFDKSGTMLTDKKKYKEFVRDGIQTFRGDVKYRDKTRDLALVYLKSLPPGTKPIKLAKKSTSVNSTVWNIGNPGADDQVFGITKGEVRSVGDRKFTAGGGGGDLLFIKCKMVCTTNMVNPGDSGGPLFNKFGEQVAVTESVDTTARGVSMFVDISEVWAFLKEKKIDIKEESGSAGTDTLVSPKNLQDPKNLKDPKNSTANSTKPAVTAEKREKDAVSDLALIKLSAGDIENDMTRRENYLTKLKAFIVKFTGTKAASEAKKIIDQLQ
jgi:hypothetical protein